MSLTSGWVLGALVALLVTPGARGEANVSCPTECTCSGLTVSCGRRGLTQVPRHLPTNAQRM